jgi:enterochelin esterase-like enzyme
VALTSPALPYLLTAICVLLLAGIIVAWPRLAGRGLLPIGLRVVSLCLLQACVLSLIFVTVNRSAEFYSSWTDLFGADSGGAKVLAAQGGFVRTQPQLSVTGHVPVRVPGGRADAAGTLERVTIHGPLSGLRVTGNVYLPAGYQQSNSSRRYPVLVVISDAPAGSSSPYAANRLAQSVAVEIAAGRLEPLIVLMLPPTLARNDRACLNVPPTFGRHRPATASVQGETFFAQDVPDALESAYRVSSQPAGWALLADEAGGYCALQLAMDNSSVFSAAVVPPGNYSRPPGVGPALDTPELRDQDNLIWQLSHLPMQPVSVLFAGPSSASGAGQARAFIAKVHRPMRVSLTQLTIGTWPLAPVLDWVGAVIAAHPDPAATR